MSASVPSFTKSYHTSSYPALDPARPDLSTNGKLVIVALGQGDGDKYSPAFAFLESGASRIAILGSGEDSATALLTMKDAIETVRPSTMVQTFFVDIWSTESIATAAHSIRASLGAWDVFVQGSCYATENTTLAGADTDEWWHIFELNIRFTHLFAKHFMPKARPDATYISFFSPATCGPASLFKGESAYVACQLAMRRLNDYLAAEHPNLRVFNMHHSMAGQVRNLDGTLQRQDTGSSDASAELFANFCVWLVSPEQDFLRGRDVWCNWDIDELVARKSEIETNSLLLTPTIGDWPLRKINEESKLVQKAK